MASSTFKSVSDTIRSKAQIFYVDTERPDTHLLVETTHSAKNEHRQSILSSLRSRTSRNRLNDDFQTSVTATTRASDMCHEIHVEIPDSTLLETMGLLRKETITDQDHDSMPPTMVALMEEASGRTSTDTAGSPISLKTFITHATADANKSKAADAPPINYNQNQMKADVSNEESCGKEIKSVSDKVPDISLPNHSDHIPVSSLATISSIRSHLGGNLFVKGNREQTRNLGIPSPYRRALRLGEEAVSESTVCNSDGKYEVGKTSQEDKVSSRLSLKLTTSMPSGLSDLVFISPAQFQPAGTAEIGVNSSEAYDADEEYGSERSEEPSMGPKSSWEKARADRQRRYHFVRSMSAETASDHSDVPGLELRQMRDQSNAHNNSSDLVPKSISSVATPGSIRRVHFELMLDHTKSKQVSMLTPGINEHLTDAAPEIADNEQELSVANLEVLKQASDLQRLPTIPSSCLQENLLPDSGLQMRRCSAHSDITSSGCDITTTSRLSCRPIFEETNYVQSNHARQTFSIIGAMDPVRDNHEAGKADNEKLIFLRLNEESGCPGISTEPGVLREYPSRSPAYVEKHLDSTANLSISAILCNTETQTTRSPMHNDLYQSSVSRANEPSSFIEDHSIGMILPLPDYSSNPYHEPRAEIKTYRSMPGAFELSPAKQSHKVSVRNSQYDDTRNDTPNLFASVSNTRPSSVDFSVMNPEVDHYLARAFSSVPYRVTESEYSDGENGFRTPNTTPVKQGQEAESCTGGPTEPDLHPKHPSEQAVVACQFHDPSTDFIAARLPKFAASPVNIADSPVGGEWLSPFYNEFSLNGVALPKNITPPSLLIDNGDRRDPFSQMESITYGDGELTYHSGNSPHVQLQTSSLKKGVWWNRVQKMLKGSESPCAERLRLQTLDDDLDSAQDTLRSVDERINESNMNINDLRALLGLEHGQEQHEESGSPSTETQTYETEGDNLAMATGRSLIVENGIQQNRKTISDINALLATATPFVNECIYGKGADHGIGNSKDIQWKEEHATNKYLVHLPAGDADSLNAVDIRKDYRLRFDVEQDDDADRFATLFPHSISSFEGFQTLRQEIEAAMESLQGEEMVSSEESDMGIVGSVLHTMRHGQLRSSEDSWYSFEMD
ncbi:hypothetical protein MMC26_000617 [Xylographa opegraphella]|nr:hypothetical protein [Xylographa opegraphella]